VLSLSVQGRRAGLLSQIEQDVLDDGKPIGSALRRCMLLGSRTGSSQLREWATLELKGYPVPAEVPDYRVIAAGLHLDAVTGRAIIKGQPISSRSLPDFVAEHVSERLPLTQAVDELEALAARFEDSGEYLKLAPPMAAEIASYMNYQIGDPYQQIQAIYWSVHPSVIRGVLGQVRTVLTEFVAELRAAVGESEELPSPGQTNDGPPGWSSTGTTSCCPRNWRILSASCATRTSRAGHWPPENPGAMALSRPDPRSPRR